MPDLDYSIGVETGGDYAGMYGAKVWERGQRASTVFVLGDNASLHRTYESAREWVEAQTGRDERAVERAIERDLAH